jgi:TolA-binding protein
MRVADLHPEALLDKEIRGELEPAERDRLEAHLAACPTCRLERRMRADFALELSAEGVPRQIAGLVETAARQAGRPVVRAGGQKTRLAKTTLLVAAATLTIVAGAFASTEAGRRVLAPLLGRSADPAGREAVTTASVHVAGPAQTSAPAEPPMASATGAEPQPPAASAPPAPPAHVVSPESAATLFDAETEARRNGDMTRVLELHAQLVARYPLSNEARVSRMTVARMLLDRGDAAGALAGFDAYLRAGAGELREEALAGRATALDRLGRTDEARAAWLALLDEYPVTPYAAHARARIEALDGR